MDEIWKDIKGWEGLYQVYNLGHVRSLDRVVRGKITKHFKGQLLKLRHDKDGYMTVHLRDAPNGRNRLLKVHRLVADAFVFRDDLSRNSIDHINGKRDDNRAENLRWCTVSENANFPLAQKNRSDSIRMSYVKNPDLRKVRAETWGKANSVSVTVFRNGVEIGVFESQTEAAKALCWSQSKVSAVMCGRLKVKDYKIMKTIENGR